MMVSRFRSALRYLLIPIFQAGVFAAGVLPRSLGYWLSSRGGDLAYYLLPMRRRVTAENYARVLGTHPRDVQVLRAVRNSLRNYGCYLYETVLFSHQTTEEVLRRVSIHFEENLRQALGLGKGVIFVSAHFGNMELAAVALANRVAPMTVAGTALEPRQVMDRLIRQRASKGLHMSVYAAAARDVLMALKRNETVGFLVDVGVRWGGGSVEVDFFGKPAPFPAGLALLALKTGAPVVPGYAVVRPDHGVEAFALPPIVIQPSGDKLADARQCMQRVAHALESFIRDHPEQWYMFRPMWHEDGTRATSAVEAAGAC